MNRELALFAELWPHINKKSPAGTEDSVSLSETNDIPTEMIVQWD